MFDVVAAACAIQLVLFGAFAAQLFSTSSRRWILLPLYFRFAAVFLVVLSAVAAVTAGFELLSSQDVATTEHAVALGTFSATSGLSTACFDLTLVLQARQHMKHFCIRLPILAFTGLCATLACFGSIWAAVALSTTSHTSTVLASLSSDPAFLLATVASALGDLLVGTVLLFSLPSPKNSSTSLPSPMPASAAWLLCVIILSTTSAIFAITALFLPSTTLTSVTLSLRFLETPIYGLAFLSLSTLSPHPSPLLDPTLSQSSHTSSNTLPSSTTEIKPPSPLSEIVVHPANPSRSRTSDFTARHKQHRSTSAIDDRHLRSLCLRPSSLASDTGAQEERRRKRLSRERFEGQVAQVGAGLERARSPPYLSSVSWGGKKGSLEGAGGVVKEVEGS